MKKLILSGVVFDASKTHNYYIYDKDCVKIACDPLPLVRNFDDSETIVGEIKIWIEKTEDGYDKVMGTCEIIIEDDVDRDSYISDLIKYSTINASHGLTFCLYATQVHKPDILDVKRISKMVPSMVSIIPQLLNSDPTQPQINISLGRVKNENNIQR